MSQSAAVVGVPEITPVAAFSDSPAARVPDSRLQVSGSLPPVAVSASAYGTLRFAVRSPTDGSAICTGATSTMSNGTDSALATTPCIVADASSVKPSADWPTDNSGNVAMPIAFVYTPMWPLRLALPGLFPSVSVTRALAIGVPFKLSRTCTWTAGAIATVSNPLVGICRKNKLAPVGVTSGGSVLPSWTACVDTGCAETAGVTDVTG